MGARSKGHHSGRDIDILHGDTQLKKSERCTELPKIMCIILNERKTKLQL